MTPRGTCLAASRAISSNDIDCAFFHNLPAEALTLEALKSKGSWPGTCI